MIKYTFNIEHYWKVIVYYNINYNLFHYIHNDLLKLNINNNTITRIYNNMKYENAKAVTISNTKLHISVVLFNKHNQPYDYINSIVHESEHIKQSILKAYNVADKNETPAYTIGYIASNIIKGLYHINV